MGSRKHSGKKWTKRPLKILKKLYNANQYYLDRRMSEILISEQPFTEVFRTTCKRRCQLTKAFLLILMACR